MLYTLEYHHKKLNKSSVTKIYKRIFSLLLMDSFLKRTIEGRGDAETHKYFLRFGKGNYGKRFLFKLDVGKRIKIRTSFELANDLVAFVRELKPLSFTGKILTKDKIAGKDGRKKAGVFVYEVTNEPIESFGNVYYTLLDTDDTDIVLKIKKSLPKPGKNEEKIDDTFCSLDIDVKYLPQVRQTFFWDVLDGKKVLIEHELQIQDILFPAGEKDPVKIRELAKRKGTMVRKMTVDGVVTEKKYDMEA